MEQDDVARLDHGGKNGVALEHLVEDDLLLAAERSAVPGHAVQHVVQPLGDREEVRVAGETSQRADPGPTGVGQQAWSISPLPALGRGVDVPDGPAARIRGLGST